jgi:hypothetical protein
MRGTEGAQMPKISDNPDRNFSTDPANQRGNESLRLLLKQTEAACAFDLPVQRRIGELIGWAAFKPVKAGW